MAAVEKRRSDDFFIEEEAKEEVLTDTSSVGSPSGSSIGENSSSEAAGRLLPRRRLRPVPRGLRAVPQRVCGAGRHRPRGRGVRGLPAWRARTASPRRSRTPPTP
jgi:hypothetical protein